MTIEIIAAFVGVLGMLQVLSMILTNLESAASQIEGRTRWTAPDGTTFEEFAVTEMENSQVLTQDFEVSCAESIMATHFAGVESNS